MKSRAEPWGAWVRLDAPPALVAVDVDRARSLGVEGAEVWGSERASDPLEVHLAVTSRCAAGCEGCYMDATADGAMPPFETLTARLDDIAASGAFTVAFGGGEPLARDDLGALAAHAKRLGLAVVMTTSGFGLTPARAAELRGFDQVNVSHDGVGGAYERVRGVRGEAVADRALELLRSAGVAFGANLVLTRETFDLALPTARHLRAAGARELQLLRYKPAGRVTHLDYLAKRLSPEQARRVPELLRALVKDVGLPTRVDCSMVPFLSTMGLDEGELSRWGILGCEAGRYLATVDVEGRVAGCSFQRGSDARAVAGFAAGPSGADARAYADAPSEPCRSCPLRGSCRGGCRVVASFLGDAHGPDPECPRVLAHRGAA